MDRARRCRRRGLMLAILSGADVTVFALDGYPLTMNACSW